MVSELDRRRVAQQLVEAHGEGAAYQTGARGPAFLREGNNAGFYLWQGIAIKEAPPTNSCCRQKN
jgi:hypothetical protein